MTMTSEIIESNALGELHQVATREIREKLGLENRLIRGSIVSLAQKLPSSAIVINRAFVRTNDLADVIRAYKDSKVSRYFLHMTEDINPEQIEGLKLKEARAWQKFKLDPENKIHFKNKLEVKELTREENRDFAEIICNAFDLGEIAVPWLSRMPLANNWHCFAAILDQQIAGVGSLYIKDNKAWVDFGATAPEFRCRGCQSAVLNARINYAFEQGCTEVYTCTGVDVEGDPQHSYKNIIKFGFQPSYIRKNYCLK